MTPFWTTCTVGTCRTPLGGMPCNTHERVPHYGAITLECLHSCDRETFKLPAQASRPMPQVLHHTSAPHCNPYCRLTLSCVRMQVLSWIDICAGLAAKTVARGPVVTASVDTVHFLRPCHQGSVAIIAAMVNRVFQSSMEASIWDPDSTCMWP